MVYVDQGYLGDGYTVDSHVYLNKRRRSRTAQSVRRWMKRRAAIETGIGHLKQEHRMDRNLLKGVTGDRINALLSATGMNLRKLLRILADLLSLFCLWTLVADRVRVNCIV